MKIRRYIRNSPFLYLNLGLPDSELSNLAARGQELVVEKEKRKAVAGGSLPNLERKRMRSKIEATVRGHPKCTMAEALHQRLIMHNFAQLV